MRTFHPHQVPVQHFNPPLPALQSRKYSIKMQKQPLEWIKEIETSDISRTDIHRLPKSSPVIWCRQHPALKHRPPNIYSLHAIYHISIKCGLRGNQIYLFNCCSVAALLYYYAFRPVTSYINFVWIPVVLSFKWITPQIVWRLLVHYLDLTQHVATMRGRLRAASSSLETAASVLTSWIRIQNVEFEK